MGGEIIMDPMSNYQNMLMMGGQMMDSRGIIFDQFGNQIFLPNLNQQDPLSVQNDPNMRFFGGPQALGQNSNSMPFGIGVVNNPSISGNSTGNFSKSNQNSSPFLPNFNPNFPNSSSMMFNPNQTNMPMYMQMGMDNYGMPQFQNHPNNFNPISMGIPNQQILNQQQQQQQQFRQQQLGLNAPNNHSMQYPQIPNTILKPQQVPQHQQKQSNQSLPQQQQVSNS